MFYLALGYFLSYLPYALPAKALSSGIVPGVDAPVGGLVLLPAAARGQVTAEHRAAVLELAPDVADRTHLLAETDIPAPAATSLDDHRHIAVVIQQAVWMRLTEQFS